MKSDLVRNAWSVVLVIAFLGGCNGLQPQVEPAALTQMATQSSLRNVPLLYVSDDGDNFLYVFSLPAGKLVRKISGFRGIAGVCSDEQGDVFVVDYQAASIKEYRHGAKEPIAVLNDPEATPVACSIDPTTGNLAVANDLTVNGSHHAEPGDVAIYAGARGMPTSYTDPNMVSVDFDSYDAGGNLYVEGQADTYNYSAFAVLYKDGDKLTNLTLDRTFSARQGTPPLQWDGKHLAVANANIIYQFKIKGTKGTKVGATTLGGASSVYDFWIQNHVLYAPGLSNSQPMVGFYSYPSGGQPTKTLLGFANPISVTVSRRP